MYRASPVSRRVTTGRGLIRVARRRLTAEAAPPPPIPKKKTGVLRRIFWTTATLTGTFYIGSTFISFKNQTYYDIFSDYVPFGQSLLEYGESHNWETLTPKSILEYGQNSVTSAQRFITDKINGTTAPRNSDEDKKWAATKKAQDRKVAYTDSKSRVKAVVKQMKTDVHKGEEKLLDKAAAIAKAQDAQFVEAVQELVRKAEAALGKDGTTAKSSGPETSPPENASDTQEAGRKLYTAPLPLGFEPPPGFSRPAPKKEVTEAEPTPVSLPLVAPSVSSLSASEPIIAHLAGTIDNLASYLASNPSAASKATDVLETAKADLTGLADRIQKVKDEERSQLEQKLDEQTREYTLKLMELEMEAQDKLDSQEEGFRKYFDEEKVKFVQAYREKLDHELRTQTELINTRLKEEVIAQGIELQRRWIREIKVRVEQERGGRLAKLDELAAQLKRLERVALDNSAHLDENIRIHALWSAFRALDSSTLESPVRKPFRDELRVLRHITAARDDPVVSSTLESLESTNVPDIGVEPFADLASWFTSSVAPKVCTVALLPDQNAGVLSHLASHLFSYIRFRKHGLATGDDVLSVVARAEYYLNEKDLNSAARELNQRKGTAKLLLNDWLEAARRRLEVQQALGVVKAQATLASLLVI